jgi:hypothetical protein
MSTLNSKPCSLMSMSASCLVGCTPRPFKEWPAPGQFQPFESGGTGVIVPPIWSLGLTYNHPANSLVCRPERHNGQYTSTFSTRKHTAGETQE